MANNAAEHYKEMFQKCYDGHQHHLQIHVIKGKPLTEYLGNCVGHCSKCMCIFTEKTIDDRTFGVWINPANFEILAATMVELRNFWEEAEMGLYEYPNPNDPSNPLASLIYTNHDAHGKAQLRYIKENEDGDTIETIITLPEHLKVYIHVD